MKLNNVPARLVAGDSLTLAIAVGDVPASEGWTVKLTLQPIDGGTPTVVNATDGAAEWLLELTSAQSATLVTGPQRYHIAATLGGERRTLAHGEIEVLPDPAQAGLDQRSPARRALAAIDAVLEQRASETDLKFVFEDGRSVEMMPHADLLRLRTHYARIVMREKNGRAGPRRVNMRL